VTGIIIDTALQQGLLYSLVVYGIVISFRMLNFPDLTVDGSFTLGAAVVAKLLIIGQPIILSILIATATGFIAGVATAILNRKLGISKILSGILIMLILYSVNLRIMGKANISLLRVNNVFTNYNIISDKFLLIFLFLVSFITLLILCYFSITKLGLFVRAVGDNELMVKMQGADIDWLYYFGLGLANSLVAFSGAMVSQSQGFSDINMGSGLIITALAGLIIGESVFDLLKNFIHKINYINKNKYIIHGYPWEMFLEFFSAFIGAFIYFLIIAFCLQLGLEQTDLKMATGILVIVGIAFKFKYSTNETYYKSKI
jgi:putative tryptophan/tyrosine transport system permease protein